METGNQDGRAARFAAPPPVSVQTWRPGLAPLRAPLPLMQRRLTRVLCRGLMATLGQLVEVAHAERLAAIPEPAIFALNHGNALEALLVPTALLYLRQGRPLHFLADWMYVEAPVLGWLLRQAAPVPVYGKPARFRLGERHRRERRRRPVVAACLAELERGESIGIFPEGTRNRRGGALLRGRLGLGELALAAAVPVVPATISYPAQARLGRVPHAGRLVLAIGEPLDFSAERRELLAGTASRGRLARRVVNRVMSALAGQLAQGGPMQSAVSAPSALPAPAAPEEAS